MNKPLQRLKARLVHSPWVAFAFLLGVSFIIVGLVFYLFVLHSAINKVIQKKISLSEGSEAYDKWRELPMPIYYRYYFFNITNAAEIEKSGVKPILKEVGPFTYRSKWMKKPIIFHDNGTVSYRERKTLWFERELSAQSDSVRNLVTVNGPLSVTLALLQRAPLVVRNIVSLGLSTVAEGFFIKRSARQLLFDGYPEMLTSFGPMLNPNLPNTHGRFAWLYDRNNTDDGLFTVFTGLNDFAHINQIDRFNGKRKLAFWSKDSDCNDLAGATDGQIIAPTPNDQSNGKEFTLFHPEICRKIRFVADANFNGSDVRLSHYRTGVLDASQPPLPFRVQLFRPEVNFLSSADDFPPNACYTSKITPSRPELGDLLLNIRADRNQTTRFSIRPFAQTKGSRLVFKSGVFDLSQCKYGAPALLSYPHFLHAHPNYLHNLVGLRPEAARHDFYMIVEPRTGTSLHSRARVQINMYVSKPPWISRFRYIPEIVFPVFWQELAADVPEHVAEHIGWALTRPFQLADYFSLTLIFIGSLLLAHTACMFIRFGLPESHANSVAQDSGSHLKSDKNHFVANPNQLHMVELNETRQAEQRSGFVNRAFEQEANGQGR